MKILSTLLRVYLKAEHLDESIAFYEKLYSQPCTLRFQYAEMGLELAQVGSMLLIAGSEQALAPFRATQATYLVDSLEAFRSVLLEAHGEILKEPQRVPTGMNMLARHPDGTIVEYVQHVKEQVAEVNIG
ncbi:hypothetical protein EI42_02813 [Thermosporothrix hazakensis]|jgi:predicted enzyme related to lactoylglutathione lyase|uniref:Uncharacterized protein n=2 Tax=Thermosporothrix TaxID=768650 RepID=A0A326UKS9_THEHA|nr:VOC family protein [Thermosporothrix hazakensis]PZW29517.1 hypothetical protein EI42_02813 [Thermosporothrix hazakensis]BBH85803.1 dioxygenase [Thermosporothrix sp. COM3]GCE45768.1 dioxygenase [Thermosporothrix hazakensis]